METSQVVKYEDFLTLLWWSATGFKRIKEGSQPKETAEKYLDGIDKILEAVEVGNLKKT